MDRRTFMRSAGTALAVIAPTAAIASIEPSETPSERIARLVVELQDALIDLNAGPIRAYVTSDQDPYLQNLEGAPMFAGKRIAGVPVQLLRKAL